MLIYSALAASLESTNGAGSSGTSSRTLERMDSDEAIEAANRDFQEKRAVDREKQRLEREARNGSRSGTTTPRALDPQGGPSGAGTLAMPASRPTTASASTSSSSSNLPSGNAALKPGGLAFDRAQMEKERLARQKAREEAAPGSQAGPSTERVPRTVMGTVTPIAGSNRASSSANSSAILKGTTAASNGDFSLHPLQSPGPFPRDAAGEYYLDGELRHTELQICKPTSARTFSLPQVIGEVCAIPSQQ